MSLLNLFVWDRASLNSNGWSIRPGWAWIQQRFRSIPCLCLWVLKLKACFPIPSFWIPCVTCCCVPLRTNRGLAISNTSCLLRRLALYIYPVRWSWDALETDLKQRSWLHIYKPVLSLHLHVHTPRQIFLQKSHTLFLRELRGSKKCLCLLACIMKKIKFPLHSKTVISVFIMTIFANKKT